jgi:CDP-6-deoxy-D-xylo-4-hexulose-3-dehydrase
MTRSGLLRQQILALVAEYAKEEWPERPFVPGETPVPVSGRVFDDDDVSQLVDSSLDFWLTAGRFAAEFERDFARRLGRRAALLCNSGSSANLLALTTLTASELGERRLRPGDEVVTVAAGFPTTINPIIQNGLVPVFLDIELGTYNICVDRLEEAIGPRTRAIMLAHTCL